MKLLASILLFAAAQAELPAEQRELSGDNPDSQGVAAPVSTAALHEEESTPSLTAQANNDRDKVSSNSFVQDNERDVDEENKRLRDYDNVLSTPAVKKGLHHKPRSSGWSSLPARLTDIKNGEDRSPEPEDPNHPDDSDTNPTTPAQNPKTKSQRLKQRILLGFLVGVPVLLCVVIPIICVALFIVRDKFRNKESPLTHSMIARANRESRVLSQGQSGSLDRVRMESNFSHGPGASNGVQAHGEGGELQALNG